jgi:hypothetical protein
MILYDPFNMSSFKLWFADLSKDAVAALKNEFADVPQVHVMRCDVTQAIPFIDSDRPLVVAFSGNSFGMLHTGLQKTIDSWLSTDEHRVGQEIQNLINGLYYGELPVGTCLLMPSPNNDIADILAYAPVTRVQYGLGSNTMNVYNAFRSILTTLETANGQGNLNAKNLLTTCFTCLDDVMAYKEAARQMRLAWKFVFEKPIESNWDSILSSHMELSEQITSNE